MSEEQESQTVKTDTAEKKQKKTAEKDTAAAETENELLDLAQRNWDKADWFIVQTLSGHEMKVKESIEKRMFLEGIDDRVFGALIPMEKVTEIRNGEKVTVKKKFYPGYILIIAKLYKDNQELDDVVWNFIKETNGITGFINDKPQPLSEREILDIKDMMQEDSEAERPKIDYVVGEMVKIKDGSFQNLEGKIEEIDEIHGKLKLSVSIFGRSTPVDVGYWQGERED